VSSSARQYSARAGQLMRDASGTPARMSTAQFADHRLHLRRGLTLTPVGSTGLIRSLLPPYFASESASMEFKRTACGGADVVTR